MTLVVSQYNVVVTDINTHVSDKEKGEYIIKNTHKCRFIGTKRKNTKSYITSVSIAGNGLIFDAGIMTAKLNPKQRNLTDFANHVKKLIHKWNELWNIEITESIYSTLLITYSDGKRETVDFYYNESEEEWWLEHNVTWYLDPSIEIVMGSGTEPYYLVKEKYEKLKNKKEDFLTYLGRHFAMKKYRKMSMECSSVFVVKQTQLAA